MDREPVVTIEKTIGNTMYIVDYEFGENAKERAYDKIRRLLLNDPCINEADYQSNSLDFKAIKSEYDDCPKPVGEEEK